VTLVFNGLMLLVDVGVVALVWKRRGWGGRLGAFALASVAAMVLGYCCGEGGFGKMRMMAYAVFGHAVLLLLATGAVILRRYKVQAIAQFVMAAVLVAIGIDAFLIEPTWLEVTHYPIYSSKIQQPVKIVVIADLQTDYIGSYERNVLRRAAEEQADIVLFLGDYIQTTSYEQYERVAADLRAALLETKPWGRLGTYAVGGNVDPPSWPELFEGFPVEVIPVRGSYEVAGLRLTGLSDVDSGLHLLQVQGHDGFHIVFGHHPDYAMGDVDADLLLAGHTHGGQVRIPGVGPIVTLSRVPRSWTAGLTRLDADRKLIVSRGIGMERYHAPQMRFLCRPELAVIHLLPASGAD